MDFFKVTSLDHAGKLVVMGVVAGALFFLLNKYAFVPAENAIGLAAAQPTTQAA